MCTTWNSIVHVIVDV